MGSGNSKGSSKRPASFRHDCGSSGSSSWDDRYPDARSHRAPSYPFPPQSYPSSSEYHGHAAPSESYAPPQTRGSNNKLQRRCPMIEDNYHSLDEVTAALAQAGLESSNLIVGIDFTKSNEWTGARSFNRQSLHHIGDSANPYEQAISIIGRTLSAFDEDNLIPCFGFGDASTHDQDVFSFHSDESSCSGFEEVLKRYREIVPHLRLAGPTSFAPIIEKAMTIVEQSGGQYHVLLIIADGQVTRSVDIEQGKLSPQEQNTVDAIERASEYPLSIILVGVGDGPWDMMKEFDDNIPARVFDNFQFVNFTEIMSKNMPSPRKEKEFALAALMEIPAQYKAIKELNILGHRRGMALDRVHLPPRIGSYGMPSIPQKPSQSSNFQHSSPTYHGHIQSAGTAPTASSPWDNQVTVALAQAGLESSNLIVGIDFTKSNEWTGARSFNRRSLHHIGDSANPYEQAISIIGRTLSVFDEDNLIPCFGFGDASTHDQDVFSFYTDEKPCSGFEEVLRRYREILPHLQLAGPTSFAPIIEMAMTIVEQSGGQYHILLIIADGQVTRSVDTGQGHLSPQEQNTVDAIERASEYPLSIILVGVGDGPWDMMKEFDDNIPARVFDNFHFVNFTEIMSKNMPPLRKEQEFALAALMEIPAQYKAIKELNILGRRRGMALDRVPLPPRFGSYGVPSIPQKPSQSSSFQHSSPPYHTHSAGTAAPASSSWDNQVCPICLTNPKDMAFGCGHQTCCDCGSSLTSCPICRSPINTRIKLY